MARIFGLAIYALIVSCAPSSPLLDMQAGEQGRVVKIIDGDALILESGQSVRLVSILAPVLSPRDRPPERYAGESARTLEDLALGRRVQLYYPGLTRDRYDRALAGGTATARLAFGRYTYGTYTAFLDQLDTASYDIARIGLDYQYPLSAQTVLAGTVQRARLLYSDPGIDNVYRNLFRATVQHALPNADQVTASLSLVGSKSARVNQTSQAWALNGSYGWAAPIGPVSLSVTGGLSFTDFPEYLLGGTVEGGREDRGVSLGLNMGVADIDYAGFSPAVSITANRIVSNISRFDRDTVTVGLTLQSSF